MIGFFIGFFHIGAIQDIVENAQVIAGLIQYENLTPQLYFQKNLWSLPPQICSIFLMMGMSEVTLNFIVTGFVGALSFVSLFILFSSFKKSADWYDFLFPLLFFSFKLFNFAPTYDISLMDTFATSGVIGFSTSVLIIGLFLRRSFAIGLFLLGLLPCIHPVWSFWMAIICLVMLLSNRYDYLLPVLKNKWFLIAGLVVSGVSALVFFNFQMIESPWSSEQSERLVAIFKRDWEVHRVGFGLKNYVTLFWGIGIFSFLTNAIYKKPVRRILQILVYTSIAFYLISFAFQAMNTSSLMFQRFHNLPIYILSIYMFANIFSSKVYSALFLIGLSFLSFYYSGFKLSDELINIFKFNAIIYLSILYVLSCLMRYKNLEFKFDDINNKSAYKKMNYLVSFLLLFSLYRGYGVELIYTTAAYNYNKEAISNYQTNKFFKNVSEEGAPIISCPNCRHVQYLTKNPILIEVDTMDDLSYFPAISSRFNEILKNIYGYGFEDRPSEWGDTVHIPENAIKKLWEKRTLEEWKTLSKTYEFKGIITPKEWNLSIGLTYEGSRYNYYRIEN